MRNQKRKLKPRWEVILPTLVGLVLIIFLLVNFFGWLFSLFLSSSDPRNSVYCSRKSINTVNNLVNKTIEKTDVIGDYFFYGESLVLTSERHDRLGKENTYSGKNIKLVDICSNKSYNFKLGDKFDDFIPIKKLGTGIYEVYLIEGDNEIRLSAGYSFQTEIYTVVSNQKSMLVTVFADKNYFNKISEESLLKENYLFIKVNQEALPSDVYDIIIDPQYNEKDDDTLSNDVKAGSEEAIKLFDMANKLAANLRTQGFKVAITRDTLDEEMLTYGIDGRINRVIDSSAKYYIGLTLNESPYEDKRGVRIIHSAYSSDTLAESIYNQLSAQGVNFDSKAVLSLPLIHNYDSLIDIREMGGIALQAATYSSYAQMENESFAVTVKGVNGISISLGYISNEEDKEEFANKYESWVQHLSIAISDYLKK